MPSLFLFTGENAFALREEKRRWMREFAQKHGPENISEIVAAKLSLGALYDEVAAAPFIAAKRLVVVDGLPAMEKEDMQKLPEIIHPDVLVLLIDPAPDKRKGAVKELLKTADVKTFAPLSPAELRAWMKSQCAHYGCVLDASAAAHLLVTHGNNQEALSSDIQKLASYGGGKTLTQADIAPLVMGNSEQVIWHLFDLLGEGKTKEALVFTSALLASGENPHALWSRMLWMFSNLTMVAASVSEGSTNPAAIAKETGINMFSVRSLVPLAKSLGIGGVRRVLHLAVEADIALKTGGYKGTGEAPEELLALIDRSILSLRRS